MLRRISITLKDRVPVSPQSALRNPRSFKARTRQAIAKGMAAQSWTEDNLTGIDPATSPAPRLPRSPQSKSIHGKLITLKRGRDIADQAKSMTDGEWEAVPIDDKHAFTKYIAKTLKEQPTSVTEQQRRRYFETTMVDPRDLNPHQSVKDTYERIKLGLPVEIKDPQRKLGVSDAMYEAADASKFDPNDAHVIENAMTHMKQVFADYVKKKRQGMSTEAERRQLAALSADLNHHTQQHLAHMFKRADEKIQEIVKEERKKQLMQLRAISDALHNKKPRAALPTKQQRLKEMVRKCYGLDVDVAATILKNLRAQEDFLEMCEVMLRMVHGSGFTHTAKDESLQEYIDSLRKLYSMNPETFADLDVVKFMAATEHVSPIEWAKRWYEKALLLPLQKTEEYKALRRIQEQEEENARALQTGSSRSKSTDDSTTQSPADVNAEATGSESADPSPPREAVVALAVAEAAKQQQTSVINLVEKMFLRPDDKRLASIHEKRLRHLAYVQLESQVKRAREHAKKYEGVEHLPEAAQCRELYQQLQARRAAIPAGDQATELTATTSSLAPQQNVFADSEMQRLFDEIRTIVKKTIRTLNHKNAADRKAAQIARVLRVLKGDPNTDTSDLTVAETAAEQAARLLQEKKRAVMERILSVVEADVREDVAWIENLQEQDRPALLPVPEPMSYVSAQDVFAWKTLRAEAEQDAGNPFKKKDKTKFQASLLGMPWNIPDKPMLFWGTGITALQQGLRHAAEDAERKRGGASLPPPYPCPENPWGWRLAHDILDD